MSPNSFGETVLRPIHESGPTSDQNNFRGIALVNSMHKIFSSILNKRLYSWAEGNKKLDESQAGFSEPAILLFTIYFPLVLLYKNICQDVGGGEWGGGAILLFIC